MKISIIYVTIDFGFNVTLYSIRKHIDKYTKVVFTSSESSAAQTKIT